MHHPESHTLQAGSAILSRSASPRFALHPLGRSNVLNAGFSRRLISLIALLVITMFGQPLGADPVKHGELIKQYDQAIGQLVRTIGAAKAHRTALIERMDSLGSDLEHIETAADKTNVKNPSLKNELQQQKTDLARIEALLQEKKIELKQQQELGNDLPIPGVFADALADRKALEHHREIALWQYRIHLKKRKIESISSQKAELVSVINTTKSRTHAVRASIRKLAAKQQSMNIDKLALEEKFSGLSADIVRQQDRLERMNIRRRILLEKPEISMNFSKFRGSLPDPTEGTLYKRYAEPKAEGLLKWEGILVKAPLGQEIEAVFDGKVVFAGEIQGLGNVAIIDHDMDYMTLYGMAELLVVAEQQNVIAGQVIGTVGESVGDEASALYFEVRLNAETVNPEDWLSMQLISSEPTE